MKELTYNAKKVTEHYLYFICFLIENLSRKQHQPNRYVVNKLGKDILYYLLGLNDVMADFELPGVLNDIVTKYQLEEGDFDVTDVDPELVTRIPNANQMAKVYKRLILATLQPEEDYVDGVIRVYNDEICDTIDNYNCSAYYEPSYVITKAYLEGEF